jgi:hypothetical protein
MKRKFLTSTAIGTEPPGEQYAKDFESFRGTPYGQKADYGSDFDRNIRLVENYKNIKRFEIEKSWASCNYT